MFKGVYNIKTKMLIVIGDNIQTLITPISEMSEWNSVCDLEGNPIYDIQLDHDDSWNPENIENTELVVDFYNLQYVNLIDNGSNYSMGHDWRNAELTIMNGDVVLGIKDEYKFNPNNAKFFVENINGDLLVNGVSSLNHASDIRTNNEGSVIYAIDDNGIRKDLSKN